MPFVAGSRLVLAALAFFPIVNAKDESLCEGHGRNLVASTHYVPTAVTSSVTYCAPPETLLIQQFDLAYFAKNSSILFNISAASVVSCCFHITATIPHNQASRNPMSMFLPTFYSMCTARTPSTSPLISAPY
jgi:hypothetical protein